MRNSIIVLTASALGLTLSGLIILADRPMVSAHDQKPDLEQKHWSYSGSEGPEYWGNLAKEYKTCSTGEEQSPIDLKKTVDAELEPLQFNYQSTPLNIVNNGHTIQVNYAPGNTLTLDGKKFELLQFHFHDPSEHTVDGSSHPMEVHLVHKNKETGQLAVVGMFLDLGEKNETLEAIWEHMPMKKGPAETVEGVTVNIADLLPQDTQNYFRYYGSLTTPPCSEVVNWIILKEPVKVSSQQVEKFAAIVGENARPAQVQGRRFILN